MNVGDGFYVFVPAFLSKGYELQRRWVTEVTSRGIRHAGFATECSKDGLTLPWGGSQDLDEAFRMGKARYLMGIEIRREQLLKDLTDLETEAEQLRNLQLSDVKTRGDNETFAQFKRNWDTDY